MKSMSCFIKRLFVVGLVLFTFSGCVTIPPEMKEKGIIAWSSESPAGLTAGGSSAAIDLRVTDLTKKPAAYDGGGGGAGFMRILPLVSAAAPPITITNGVLGYENGPVMYEIKKGEVESILAEELRKSGAVKNAVYEGPPKEYDVRGSIDFVYDYYMHSAGMGTILQTLSLVGLLILPEGSGELTCTARLEVVPKGGGAAVLSKDYTARSKYFTGVIYGNHDRHLRAYGAELLPQIVEQFVADLRTVPKTAWK